MHSTKRQRTGRPASVGVIAVLLISSVAGSVSAEESPDLGRGKKLFADQCARCHGGDGQGTEAYYPDPLAGDHSVARLVEIIDATMPEEDPEACAGKDARDVAAFVHRRFYSDQARRNRQAARIELSRLTVPQYRNAVTDLVQSFRRPPTPQVAKSEDGNSEAATVDSAGRGLAATYFKSRSLSNKHQVVERTDPVIDFDFGEGVPEPADEFEDNEEFSIRWEGGLFVERTGQYEIRLYSENGVKLWLNDLDVPLLDGWVRSGDKTDHVESVFLLGGRTYPLRVEFHKRKDPSAAVRLSWEPPDGVREPIPTHHLRLGDFSPVFVVSTPFPPDDRSTGYERGTRVTKDWAEATTFAAIETANGVIENLNSLAGIDRDDEAKRRRKKAKSFAEDFVERAFRVPLSDDERKRYVERHFADEENVSKAIKRVVILALKSPRFLYPGLEAIGRLPSENGDREGDKKAEGGVERYRDFVIATRLALTLCNGLPDEELRKAARRGKLHTRKQIEQHAKRLLDDPRARAKMLEFFRHWLRLDQPYDLAKDADRFPEFDSRLAADLERSLLRFIEATVWGNKSDFRELFRSDELWVNPRVAKFLELKVPDRDADFHPVEVNGEPRAGILTHPFLMSTFAHASDTSPIHRGVFLARGILGRTLRSPPDAIELVDASKMPEMTTRQRVAEQTKPDSCQNCHGMINPLGFALENYDAVGRYREHEPEGPVDASGTYLPSQGKPIRFRNAVELAGQLVEHPETVRNFVERMFEFLTKQPIGAYRSGLSDELTDAFVSSGYQVRELMVQIAIAAVTEEAGVADRVALGFADNSATGHPQD